ncbi:restriction endonuclease subunit S [Micromonospora sp. PSH03]|uniref:restriction endonuclease subunit S n=1 Tax=Micromonospora salmantinae TaxID=2911211 RepID=UPI001EE78784|nr:restriction endonuclease subunit S [Micromonospora salmantinae]MCG5457768.1 restriction endonuclease subunit S [Micromonospora salmantinae]
MFELTLGDALEALIDHRGKTPKKMGGDFTEKGAKVISALLVKGGSIDLSQARCVSDEMYEKWMRVPTKRHDVILTSEAPLGRSALIPDNGRYVLGQRVFGLRGKPGVLDSQYLFYSLQTSYVQDQLIGRSTGTTVLGIRQSELVKVRIPAADYREQQKIAQILGALDEKIAVNDRIAGCSIALADAQFNRAVEEVPTGPETFGSIAQVGGGGTPSTKVPEYWEGDIAWATPSDVTALGAPYLFGTSRRITDAGLDNCASVLYPAGSIFMTSRATIGAFAFPQAPTAVNQGFIVVVTPDEELAMWLFHEMRDRVDEMRSLANGSTFLELSRKNFKAIGVRLPTPAARKEFAGKAIPLHQRAAAATAENATLAKLRDTLLPELMSGRLRVRDAEQVVEAAV